MSPTIGAKLNTNYEKFITEQYLLLYGRFVKIWTYVLEQTEPLVKNT